MDASSTGWSEYPVLDDSHLAFNDCVWLRLLDQPDVRATLEDGQRLASCCANEARSEPRGRPDAWLGAEHLVVFGTCRRDGAMHLLCHREVGCDSAMVRDASRRSLLVQIRADRIHAEHRASADDHVFRRHSSGDRPRQDVSGSPGPGRFLAKTVEAQENLFDSGLGRFAPNSCIPRGDASHNVVRLEEKSALHLRHLGLGGALLGADRRHALPANHRS